MSCTKPTVAAHATERAVPQATPTDQFADVCAVLWLQHDVLQLYVPAEGSARTADVEVEGGGQKSTTGDGNTTEAQG